MAPALGGGPSGARPARRARQKPDRRVRAPSARRDRALPNGGRALARVSRADGASGRATEVCGQRVRGVLAVWKLGSGLSALGVPRLRLFGGALAQVFRRTFEPFQLAKRSRADAARRPEHVRAAAGCGRPARARARARRRVRAASKKALGLVAPTCLRRRPRHLSALLGADALGRGCGDSGGCVRSARSLGLGPRPPPARPSPPLGQLELPFGP